MIDEALGTIATLARVIIANRKGHKRRARNLEVFEREIVRLFDIFNASPISYGTHLRDDLLIQVQDALTAIRTLAHGPLGEPFNEAHFDIEQRLYLLIDVVDWLRDKIREGKPYTLFDAMEDERKKRASEPATAHRDTDEIPF